MQECSPEGSEGVLLNPGLKIVQVTVPAGEGQVGHIYEIPSIKSGIVLALA